MSPESHAPLMLVLSRRSAGGRLAVDLQSYLRFSAQMDQQLEALVQRWSDFSTPAARHRAVRADQPLDSLEAVSEPGGRGSCRAKDAANPGSARSLALPNTRRPESRL